MFFFLLYAPVGAKEWQRESKDQAAQEATNQTQELRIEQLDAELVALRALIKTKETSRKPDLMLAFGTDYITLSPSPQEAVSPRQSL